MKPLRDRIAEAIVEANLVSHSLAFPIADAVLRIVGNGTIKALEEENAQLNEQLEIEKAAATIGRREPYHCDGEKIIAWLDNPDRKPANTAFTEGLERQIAYRIEGMLARLRARLEIDLATDGSGNPVPHPAPEIDGIACREETIKLLEEENARLQTMLLHTLENPMNRVILTTELTAWLEQKRAAIPPDEMKWPEPERYYEITTRLLAECQRHNVKAIAGYDYLGYHFAAGVCSQSWPSYPLPALLIRDSQKGHGAKELVAGPRLEVDARVAIILTDPKGLPTAMERLRDVGYNPCVALNWEALSATAEPIEEMP